MSRTKTKRKRFLVQTQGGEFKTTKYSKKGEGSIVRSKHTFIPKKGKKGMRRIVGSFDTRNEAEAFAGTSGRWVVIDTGEQT